jgi:predicted metal-dependent hydrolase
METLHYGERAIQYNVTQTMRLASKILIHVLPDGTVKVDSPMDGDPNSIRRAIQKRARWIFENLDAVKDARVYALPREFIGGETHFYLGRRYRLSVIVDDTKPSCIKLLRGRLEVTTPDNTAATIKRHLTGWYQGRAKQHFAKRVREMSALITWIETVPSIKLVPMEYQWGSCSPTGSINLNPALIKAPRHCIDYVLTHELCHLREHNHSKRFYALLQRHCPNWEATKAELDSLAELLLVD